MVDRKKIKTRGKLKLSKYFQEFEKGDKAAVTIEPSVPMNFPKVLQGRTGNIIEKRGKAYMIMIKDHNEEKHYLIEPIHLKKIKQ